MPKLFTRVLLALMCCCLFSLSCSHGEGAKAGDGDSVSVVDTACASVIPDSVMIELTPQQVDSIVFRLSHHYSQNFNFKVCADSLMLVPMEGDLQTDTLTVYSGDLLVVANIRTVPEDSIDSVWVKVAHDQFVMGWIPESVLLKGTTPDDMISQMLNFLTGSRSIWMSGLVGLGVIAFLLRRGKHKKLQIVRFVEMDSFYPILLVILVSLLASLYASIQNFVPEYWQEYYFHPTMNPLRLPALMSVLVTLVWLVIIVYLAVVEEVYKHFYFVQGVAYLVELTGIAMLVYLLISWSTLCYIGYVIMPVLVVLLVKGYCRYIRCRYVCGQCGQRIRRKGKCPHCGACNG